MRPLSATSSLASRPKTYRICPECPFFCRTEELIVRCPWCRVRLLSRCACNAEIADPAEAECARCGSARRRARAQRADLPDLEVPQAGGESSSRR